MNWQASWIWHPPQSNMDNFYLLARKTVRLSAVPADARVFVTAGSLYKLYVNGREVGRGPNPSDPSRYYYDVHAVGPFLREGENVIAAVAYNYGPRNRGILGQNGGRGGLLLELRAAAAGPVLAATDATWRVIQAPEWDQAASLNCTLYGDFKETIDTRREIAGWREPGFDDAGWLAPEVLGRPPLEPYTTLVEREIPFLGGPRAFPENAYWESASVTYAWRDDWEVYHEQNLVPSSPFLSGKPVEVRRTHDDFAPSILLDFGRLLTGYPGIRVLNSGGGTLDVLYGESLHLTRVDRFHLKGGPQTLQPFNRRTFRYMRLLFPDTPQRIDLERVWLDVNTYPVEPRGAFTCSDPLLNRIWDIGRHTMQMSMLDHFVDCPWRERTIYGGDVYAENVIAYYAFGDARMNRKVLRQMFAIQHAEGALPPYGPYRGCHGFYPSWSGFLGLAFLDHHALSGDDAFLGELWPRFARLLDWAAGEIGRNTPHLIGSPAKGGSFEEWSRQPKEQFAPWSNAPFYPLLRRGAGLARARGEAAAAARWATAADSMASAIRATMLDGRGLFVRRSPAGARATAYDAGQLLWMGMLDREEGARAAAHLSDPDVTPIDCPFSGAFVIEGLFRHAGAEKALAFIRDYWGSMVARGATTFWEHFSRGWADSTVAPARGTSLCHGWSAWPTYALGAHVLGVTPLTPGFAAAHIAPQPGDLQWAEGRVPTPAGDIAVRWERTARTFTLKVAAPDSTPLRVSLPLSGAGRVTLDGKAVDARVVDGQLTIELPAAPGARTLRAAMLPGKRA